MWATWLAVVLCTLLFFYVYRFYRNVARYPPGPRPLPFIGNLHQIDPDNVDISIERLIKNYGPVVTIWLPAPTVVIGCLQELREALVEKGDLFVNRPQTPIHDLFMYGENSGVLNASGTTWREQRRFVLNTLRDFGMGRNAMESKIVNSVITMFEQIDGSLISSHTLNMHWPLQLCVGNVINDLLLGYHWGADDCAKFVHLSETINGVLHDFCRRRSVMLVHAYPWLINVPIIGHWGFSGLRAEMDKIFSWLIAEVEQRKLQHHDDAEPSDFVGAYLQKLGRFGLLEQDGGYSECNLVSTLNDFWMAGMETTSTTLRWAIVLLVSYPDVQEKLQNEIDRTVGHDRLPTMADKSDMPYASAVIMELQRRANISAVNLPRCTSEDVQIGGHPIPAGTLVYPQINFVMYNLDIFPDPNRFDPERFLEADGKTFNKIAMDNMIPFGLGKRQCAGEALARMELFLILVLLMQRYSFSKPEEGSMPDLTPVFGMIRTPLPYECKVTRRF